MNEPTSTHGVKTTSPSGPVTSQIAEGLTRSPSKWNTCSSPGSAVTNRTTANASVSTAVTTATPGESGIANRPRRRDPSPKGLRCSNGLLTL